MEDLPTVNICTYSNAVLKLGNDFYFLERNLTDSDSHVDVTTPVEDGNSYKSTERLSEQQFFLRFLVEPLVVLHLFLVTMPKRVNLLKTSSEEDESPSSGRNRVRPLKSQE